MRYYFRAHLAVTSTRYLAMKSPPSVLTTPPANSIVVITPLSARALAERDRHLVARFSDRRRLLVAFFFVSFLTMLFFSVFFAAGFAFGLSAFFGVRASSPRASPSSPPPSSAAFFAAFFGATAFALLLLRRRVAACRPRGPPPRGRGRGRSASSRRGVASGASRRAFGLERFGAAGLAASFFGRRLLRLRLLRGRFAFSAFAGAGAFAFVAFFFDSFLGASATASVFAAFSFFAFFDFFAGAAAGLGSAASSTGAAFATFDFDAATPSPASPVGASGHACGRPVRSGDLLRTLLRPLERGRQRVRRRRDEPGGDSGFLAGGTAALRWTVVFDEALARAAADEVEHLLLSSTRCSRSGQLAGFNSVA